MSGWKFVTYWKLPSLTGRGVGEQYSNSCHDKIDQIVCDYKQKANKRFAIKLQGDKTKKLLNQDATDS